MYINKDLINDKDLINGDDRIAEALEDISDKLEEVVASRQVTPVVNVPVTVPQQAAPIVNVSTPKARPASWVFKVKNDKTGVTYTITATPS